MTRSTTYLIGAIAFAVIFIVSCGPTSYEEKAEFQEVAEITAFSVPDSASSTNIPVTISAILGKTTASSLLAIVSERTDSLFKFVVYSKRIDNTSVQPEIKDVTLDTTLVLSTNPPRVGLHYFRIITYAAAFDSIQVSSRLY